MNNEIFLMIPNTFFLVKVKGCDPKKPEACRELYIFDLFFQKNVGKLFVAYGEIAGVFCKADSKIPNSKFA